MQYDAYCKERRVACLNFGHPAQISSIKIFRFWQVKNNFATMVNSVSFDIVLAFDMVILFVACLHAASTQCVTWNEEVRSGCPKLGHTTLYIQYTTYCIHQRDYCMQQQVIKCYNKKNTVYLIQSLSLFPNVYPIFS